MKNFVLIAAFIVISNTGSFAQKAKSKVHGKKPVAAKPVAVKTKTEDFPREKFDPKKDPKADLDTAVTAASKSGKRIILDIGGEWCGWCVYMDKFFFQNPDLAKLRDDNYIWVKINMGPENENKVFLSSYPEIAGYPHLFVLDETGKLIQSQDTSPLEEGKGYNLARFTEFLKKWAPATKTVNDPAPY